VWTEGLLESEIDRIMHVPDMALGMAFIERVEHKMATNYVPPFGATTELTQDQVRGITVQEDIATNASIQPNLRVVYELDCPKALARELSVEILEGNTPRRSDQPTEWKRMDRESNVEYLLRILCPQSSAALQHP
jgi:hypothetical protein